MTTKLSAMVVQMLEGHLNDITSCDFSGTNLVTSSNDKTVRVWSRIDDEQYKEISFSPFLGHTYGVNCVCFSPFGTVIASCSTDGTVILWNAETGEQITQLQHPSQSAIRTCCFSPSSALLATGSDDETVILWDISTRSSVRYCFNRIILEGHEAMVTSCAFSPDSTYLLSGSSRGELKLWDARYGHGKCLLTQIEAHDLGVSCCDFNPLYEINTGNDNMSTVYIVASGGNDDLVKLWKIKAGIKCSMHLCMILQGHSANVMCCRFSKDGSLLASGAGDKSVIIRDAQSGEVLTRLERHNRYITCCAFTSDNKYLATGSNDRTVILWSLINSEIDNESSNANNSSTSRICIGPSNHGMQAVSQWSVDNVCNWLEGLNLKEYEETFRNHAIDGKELIHLTHENLLISLKIDVLGHRNKILRGIQALKNPLWQHQYLLDENITIPEEFCCPITHEKMIDPVVAMDGYSYERGAILEWIRSGKNTSPMTNELLSSTEIIPNKTLRLIIQKY